MSFILYFSGLWNASKEEPLFKTALIYTVLAVVFFVVSEGLTTEGTLLSTLAEVVYLVCECLAVLCGLRGISALAEQAGNTELRKKSQDMVMPVTGLFVLMAVLTVLAVILERAAHAVVGAGIVDLIDILLSVAVSVLCIRILYQAGKM